MCEKCGCNEVHTHDDNHDNGRHHNHHDHVHAHPSVRIPVNADILKANDQYAQRNRDYFKKKGCYVINLISSPGSGKTTLLERCAARFGSRLSVIEGDIATRRDAQRIEKAGCVAYQIETAGACHLDGHSISHALEHIEIQPRSLLIIENVGNLVCPATYDLGEHEKIAILSTPEGDDKILKYPAIFYRIQTLIINKIDLAPYVNFDLSTAIRECHSLNAACKIMPLSATTGEGMDLFFTYLQERLAGLSVA